MTSPATSTPDETEIRAALEAWAAAARAKDLEAIMAAYAPGIRSFDAICTLQFEGAESLRQHWQACLSCMQGPMLFEIRDLEIAARDDLAFAHHLVRGGGTGPDAVEHACWMRATVCLRKLHGRWLIVHDRISAPFDPESDKALLDLQPEPAERASAA